MEFGKLGIEELEKADLKLPPEPKWNATVLPGAAAPTKRIFVGCSKWGREEWVGKLYPIKTKQKDFLQHYVQHFNCVELNATHYKIIGQTGIGAWKRKADGYDFKFCPKMYKGITHAGNLNDKPFIINEFLRGIRAFGDKLGPVFIQVSEKFTPNRKAELFEFLEKLPVDMQFFIEVRHDRWFVNTVFNELLSFLKIKNIGIVITDTAGRRDCCHMHLSIPKAFVRFVGNSLHPTDFTRIDEWAKRLNQWTEKGIEEVYFMVHAGDEAVAPEMTRYVLEKLNLIRKG
jgi:uncharacterized protein YecE (DUF72 family)